MIRPVISSLLLSSALLAAETGTADSATTATQPSQTATAEPAAQPTKKSGGFKMPSFSEMSALAGNLANQVDGKLSYLEKGVATMKPTVDGLPLPANAKTAERFKLLADSLPKIRSAVDALKTGKSTDPKTDLKTIEENLKTAEAQYAQLQAMLPAATKPEVANTTQVNPLEGLTASLNEAAQSATKPDSSATVQSNAQAPAQATTNTQAPTTTEPATQPAKKSGGFKMPSISEMSALAGNLANQVDGKLSYLEKGVATMKPTVEGLALPANAKTVERFKLLSDSLPKIRSAVDALKTGKSADPKADLKTIETNLKTAEAQYAQLQAMLPAAANADKAN